MKKILFRKTLILSISLYSMLWYGCTKDIVQTGTIYGTVTDYATGEPISNVNVTLRPSGETILTGSDGSYEFNDLNGGNYSLLFSKAEYNNLDDDYVIELEAGKKVRRDVQMRKLMTSLRITDMTGVDLPSLDFGMDESVTSRSFKIFNEGTIAITCQILYNCTWIDTAIVAGTTIAPGQSVSVVVFIDRDKLSAGENRTFLQIISNNGSNELLVTATGPGVPIVITDEVSDITANSAVCGGNVISSGDGTVLDRGLCWSTNNSPTLESGNHLSIGTGLGTFSGTISGLIPNTVYYVRAYATNELGTSYGGQKRFTPQETSYDLLPTFSFNGHTYRVAPDPISSPTEHMSSWTAANNYCEGLTLYGYSDWRMPTLEELQAMYYSRETIGGFLNDSDIDGDHYYIVYYSSTTGEIQTSGYEGQEGHYTIIWSLGTQIITGSLEFYGYHVWGDGFGRAHVRPIRLDH